MKKEEWRTENEKRTYKKGFRGGKNKTRTEKEERRRRRKKDGVKMEDREGGKEI